ncbi:Na+ ABC transporter permease [Streptococcus cristatus AS 1.3089]|uniref:Na+ ABC transporter permease n=1 Tax=Streptococcus cristatus AS 1.3089 TaxID=1302863 RepID=A0ABM5NIJ9_STRCR|nr:ABC transporter permease [Streptococcus cristatus]AGK70561.1 Na+ ABC transporter permease [Streptococcus cristatus AS 1.3089]
MKQMLIVIKETYLRHVKSWSFVFMVLSPFLFLGLSLGIGYLQGSSMASSKKVAVLTQLDSVREVLRAEDQLSFQYKDEAAAKQAVKDKKIAGYLTVEEKDGQLSATYYAETSMNAATKMALSNSLIQVQQALNLAQAHLSDEQSQILARTVQFEEKIDENKESKKMVQTFAAIGLGFLLYMILITYASITAQDVASEKGTQKLMEVIFSSIKATDYFYARMIGIFAVILSHLGIYVLGGLAAFLFADRIPLVSQVLKSNPAIQQYIGEAVSLNTLAFVAVSIFMYVVLSAFLGSMVARPEDTGKVLSPVIMLILVGFMGVSALGAAGDNLILKVGSYLPFISTFFMPFRAINGYATSLEAWISLSITVAFAVMMTVFIARIYSSLVLQTDDLGAWKTFKRALKYK